MKLTFNNGIEMPALGYGVFQTPPDETAEVVDIALKTGYRHIDTATMYQNERGVGEGIRRSGIKRSDIFIETKVWINKAVRQFQSPSEIWNFHTRPLSFLPMDS